MSLLTPAQTAQIKAAILSVTDTFFRVEAVAMLPDPDAPYDRFRNAEDPVTKDVALEGFTKYASAKAQQDEEGTADLQGMELTFHTDTLKAAGLADARGVASFNPATDRFRVDGDTWVVEGVTPSGYLIDTYLLCKISLHKEHRNGARP